MNPRDRLAVARLLACQAVPYYRVAILGMRPREMPGLGALAVTADAVLLWDPVALKEWDDQELAAVLVHEATHILRAHATRMVGEDPELRNIAADLEINDDLARMRLRLPAGAIYPKTFGMREGLCAEEYLAALKKTAGEMARALKKAGAKPGPCAGKCGGCAGNPGEGEEDQQASKDAPGAAGRDGAGKDRGEAPSGGLGRSDRELERIRRQVAEATRQEAQKSRGNVPAGVARWAGDLVGAPKVPWQQRLARAVRVGIAYRPGAVDLSYARPSRRQGGIGFGPGKPLLPAYRAPVPRVSVAIDTSGSMGDKELAACMRELRGVLKATGAEVEWVSGDTEVASRGKARRISQVKLRGGGGTDFRPLIKALTETRPRPDVVVFMTDGYGRAPDKPPPCRVIWLLTPGGTRPAGWGEVVELQD